MVAVAVVEPWVHEDDETNEVVVVDRRSLYGVGRDDDNGVVEEEDRRMDIL